jgi:S1-C subfamily serine protease
MKFFSVLLIVASINSFAEEPKLYPSIPKAMLNSTFRLAASKSGAVGKGTTVAVDLTKYGLTENRYLLTATHCVRDNGKNRAVLVEVNKEWIEAKVIAFDEKIDIALLMVSQDLPSKVKFSEIDSIDIGDAILTLGSPHGTAISVTIGYFSAKEDTKNKWSQGSFTITHGNSGGPVFDANKQALVGIVVAMVEEAPNIALFVSVNQIDNFIKSNTDKIKKIQK